MRWSEETRGCLFTEVRGRIILGTSALRSSKKFAKVRAICAASIVVAGA